MAPVARDVRALQAAVRSDPVPTSGPALVRYAGGTREATRALSGLDHSPRRAEYATEGAWKADYTRWRSAARNVQRWSAPEGRERRGQVKPPKLDPAERRRLQAANREGKRAKVARSGLRAVVRATVVVPSTRRGGDDRRERTISSDGTVTRGVPIDPDTAAELLELVRAGDDEAARELLQEAFLESAGMPDGTELERADWEVWPG